MDIMYLQQPGDTELSGGDTQDIRRPLIRPEALKLRTQQSERWATTSQQQQQTHKQTQRTLYFYLFLSAGGQSQTRGASLLKIKLWNFDYHPAHSVIQHVRHTPPFINHMQSNKQPVRLEVKVDCEWLSPDLSVRQTTINKLKRSSRETQNISRTKVLSEKKKENNILISFVLKCAPISSYLHSSEAAAPVWIPAWKTLQPHPQTHSVFTHRAGSISAQDDAKHKCRSFVIQNRISSTQSPLSSLTASPLQQGHTTGWLCAAMSAQLTGPRAVNAPPPQLCADGGLYECMDTEEPGSSIVLMQPQQRQAHSRWPDDWTAAVYCQSVL